MFDRGDRSRSLVIDEKLGCDSRCLINRRISYADGSESVGVINRDK